MSAASEYLMIRQPFGVHMSNCELAVSVDRLQWRGYYMPRAGLPQPCRGCTRCSRVWFSFVRKGLTQKVQTEAADCWAPTFQWKLRHHKVLKSGGGSSIIMCNMV
jgi:hypothetical protein